MNRQQTHRIKEQGIICENKKKKKSHLIESIHFSSHPGKEDSSLRGVSNRQELPLLRSQSTIVKHTSDSDPYFKITMRTVSNDGAMAAEQK